MELSDANLKIYKELTSLDPINCEFDSEFINRLTNYLNVGSLSKINLIHIALYLKKYFYSIKQKEEYYDTKDLVQFILTKTLEMKSQHLSGLVQYLMSLKLICYDQDIFFALFNIEIDPNDEFIADIIDIYICYIKNYYSECKFSCIIYEKIKHLFFMDINLLVLPKLLKCMCCFKTYLFDIKDHDYSIFLERLFVFVKSFDENNQYLQSFCYAIKLISVIYNTYNDLCDNTFVYFLMGKLLKFKHDELVNYYLQKCLFLQKKFIPHDINFFNDFLSYISLDSSMRNMFYEDPNEFYDIMYTSNYINSIVWYLLSSIETLWKYLLEIPPDETIMRIVGLGCRSIVPNLYVESLFEWSRCVFLNFAISDPIALATRSFLLYNMREKISIEDFRFYVGNISEYLVTNSYVILRFACKFVQYMIYKGQDIDENIYNYFYENIGHQTLSYNIKKVIKKMIKFKPNYFERSIEYIINYILSDISLLINQEAFENRNLFVDIRIFTLAYKTYNLNIQNNVLDNIVSILLFMDATNDIHSELVKYSVDFILAVINTSLNEYIVDFVVQAVLKQTVVGYALFYNHSYIFIDFIRIFPDYFHAEVSINIVNLLIDYINDDNYDDCTIYSILIIILMYRGVYISNIDKLFITNIENKSPNLLISIANIISIFAILYDISDLKEQILHLIKYIIDNKYIVRDFELKIYRKLLTHLESHELLLCIDSYQFPEEGDIPISLQDLYPVPAFVDIV